MPRAIWTGSISFGLVNIPVRAYTAVRDHSVHFHRLQKGTGARVRNKKVSEKSGREVDKDNIELGYELSSGHYVTVDPDELDDLRPRTTKTIEISDFVALADIDPIYYERTYWLAPPSGEDASAYGLLLAAMQDQERVGIGTVVMRRKQYLAAIRPIGKALALSTMRFADEVVDQGDLDDLPSRRTKPKDGEMKLAKSIIDALANDWDPTRYHDTYTEELRSMIEQRAKGKDIKVEEAPAADSEVQDLMAALEASVAEAKKSRTKKPKKKTAATRKRTPRKTTTARKRKPAKKAASPAKRH